MKKTILLFAGFAMLASCSDDDNVRDGDIMCTMEVRPALAIVVKDAASKVTLTEGVAVTAVNNGTTEELKSLEDGSFTGLLGASGTTKVTVKKTGYKDKTADVITKTNHCGPITTRDTIFIEAVK